MIILNKNKSISFSKLSVFSNLICMMSSRQLGDLNVGRLPISNARKLLDLESLSINDFVGMRQIHSNKIKRITNSDKNIIDDVDGLISNKENLYLGVKGADCVPLFFYDPDKHIVGVSHAGWKGTFGKIAIEMIQEFQQMGSNPQDIIVAIGPHIGGCCYTITDERAALFIQNSRDLNMVFKSKDKWHLDLGYANMKQLLESGVTKDHIDASIVCTSCQNNMYFSYRKEAGKPTYGELLGIIGMRD